MAEPGLQRPRVVAGVSQGISVVWLAARDVPRTREAVEAAFDRRRASRLRALLHTSPRPSSTLLPQAPALSSVRSNLKPAEDLQAKIAFVAGGNSGITRVRELVLYYPPPD